MTSRVARFACIHCRTATSSAGRAFSSSSYVSGPKAAGKPKVSPYAKKAAVGGDEDAAGVSQGGNALSEVTVTPIDLSYIPAFQPESVTTGAIGEVRAYSPGTLSAFKALTLPAPLQREFSYTKRPATVIRKATLDVANLLDASKKVASRDSRRVIVGPVGSGKSVLLLQAISYSHSSGWIVLYLPSSTPYVDSSTPYAYSTTQKVFQQPDASKLLLTRFAGANKAAFTALKTTKELTFGDRIVPSGTSLEALCSKGVDAKNATAVMEAVFEQLSTQRKYPVLLAIDDAQSLFTTSSYVDPSYTPVETFSLSVPRLLLDYVSGTKSFVSGSILLASSLLSKHSSLAMSDFLSPPSTTTPQASPYQPVGTSYETYREILSGLDRLEVPARLERKEAVGVVKMLQGFRGVREVMSDQSFMERYVAADGNPREFSRRLERSSEL